MNAASNAAVENVRGITSGDLVVERRAEIRRHVADRTSSGTEALVPPSDDGNRVRRHDLPRDSGSPASAGPRHLVLRGVGGGGRLADGIRDRFATGSLVLNSSHRRARHRSSFRRIACTLLWFAFIGAAAAAPIPVEELVHGFSAAIGYEISPDGRHVLRRRLGTADLKVFPVGDGGEVGEPFDLARHRMWLPVWSRDGERLYGIGSRDKRLVGLEVDPARRGAHVREIPLPGLVGRVVAAGRHPAEDGLLLLRAYRRGAESVLRCALDGSGCTDVADSSDGSEGWRSIVDETGRPAVRHRFSGNGLEFQSRLGEAWTAVGEMPVDRTIAPLTPVDSEGWGLALSNVTTDTMSLVRWNARTLEERVVAAEPDADLRIALLSEAGEPLATTSFPGYPRTTALHPAVERALELVRAHHPGPAILNVTTATADLDRFVVEAFDEVHARVAWLVSLPEGTVEEIERSSAGRRYGPDFSPTRAVRVPARDGLTLPSLLTVPLGASESGPPPLVLMVHGGPWLFYRWTFDPLAQLLASHGFAVLKVNYRGSAGYGNRFREAAVGELAGRVQDDIEDAFEWAVREGFADRARLVLLGDSFGGFCVLRAMIRGRLPVRAGVVLSAVVDTEAMVDENTFSDEGRALWSKYLGTGDAQEMKRILREVSPLRHADRIRAPVLFVAGNADRVVQSRHAATLAERLRERGRIAELLSFPGEGHAITRPENLVEAYRTVVGFLRRHLD